MTAGRTPIARLAKAFALPLPRNGERPLPDARAQKPGWPLGQGNGNWKHGRFTKEWIEERRRLRALLRELRGLAYKDENTTDLTMTMAS